MDDPRLTPARPDLAARYLEGKVSAARFVDGETFEVITPLAPLRDAPRADAMLQTEALKSERVTIYDRPDPNNRGDGWAWGQLESDGYVGWLPDAALAPAGPAPTHKITALRTFVFPGPSIKLPPRAALTLGTTLAIARIAENFAIAHDGGYLPDKPRQYQTKAKNAQEAHEAIRPTDFSRDHVGSGDHARLYELVYKRAMASQMASARMERTVIEMVDGTGQHGLRATGQVVLFPGFLALYEEGRDDS